MSILIFGGASDIATQGIIPVVGGITSNANVLTAWEIRSHIRDHQPDVVINCAGVSHPATVADSSLASWRDEMEVNLFGAYVVANMAILERVPTLIFIASVAGLYGKPNHSGYCASKAGVISLVQSLAMEGHDAYAISPGRVDTQMRERDYPGEDPRTRLVPEQIGQTVFQILEGVYAPGDNIIIRKQGFDTYVEIDKGAPWRDYLHVGEPPLV